MNRIDARFADLKKEGRAGLVTFIMGGDPDRETCAALLEKLPEAGADLIELGMPFADPMADGPTIQTAGERALAAGMTLRAVLEMVADFRVKNDGTPIILMGYANPVYAFGLPAFFDEAKKSGVDGLIIVDLPPEEDEEARAEAVRTGIHMIRLATPVSDDKRLGIIAEHAGGFIYYVSMTGVTGAGTKSSQDDLSEAVARLRTKTSLPIGIGFGIKTPEQVAALKQSCEAVIVGSAIVATVEKYAGLPDKKERQAHIVQDVCAQVRALNGALK
ncbi:MAG: tryptophan synthase subunit alpha [Pseudobdellovibrionaceae bacterium]